MRQRRKKRKRSSIEKMIAYTKRTKKYSKVSKSLTKLNAMVGMSDVKEAVAEQLQFLITNDGNTDGHFLNTVIQGDPGCGKTSVAKILYEIWSSTGVFEDEDVEFKIMNRSDFVGSYMGHTANKTRKILHKHSGHVIFIDEAYSLCGSEKDDYGKECIDELNSFMGEQLGKTIVIIAGYEDSLNKSYFSVNAGLRRRFNWYFTVQKYTSEELYKIFVKQLREHGWKMGTNCEDLFREKSKYFKNGGGDTSNVAFKCKLEYCKRNWTKKTKDKVIGREDLAAALKKHFKKDMQERTVNNMYI